MTRVAFIGLGNMGSGMSVNQAKAGREVASFDLSAEAMARAKEQGMIPASSASEAVKDADIVVTMLPAGKHVLEVYEQAILPNARKDALLIDCSTIDVDSARTVARDASMQGFRAADAPVSGGVAAPAGGALTFMVGCREPDFAEFEEALKPMAKAIIHAGASGAGQAAKICNNMLLGKMISYDFKSDRIAEEKFETSDSDPIFPDVRVISKEDDCLITRLPVNTLKTVCKVN